MQEELNKKIKRRIDKNKLEILSDYITMNNLSDINKELNKDEIINDLESYLQFNNYFHKKYYNRNCIVTDIYQRSFGDICADVILLYDNYSLAKVTLNLDIEDIDIEQIDKQDENLLNEVFKTIAFEKFDELIRLPKLSKSSQLLNRIYNIISDSDSNMCFIDDEDSIVISNNAMETLKNEVKKYHLEDVIELYVDDYKIIGYGNLILKMNDDIDFYEAKNYFEDFKYSKNHKLDYSDDIEVYSTYLFKDINGIEFYENKIDECIILKDSNNYNEFTYDIFLDELNYMLSGNLIDEISMYGHTIIRDFLAHNNGNKSAIYNYEKYCKKNHIFLNDIQQATKEKSFCMFDIDGLYTSQEKLNRLSKKLYGVHSPIDAQFSYVASIDNGNDFYFDKISKKYIVLNKKNNIEEFVDSSLFLLKKIKLEDNFINIEISELKKICRELENVNFKNTNIQNYALEKLLDYNKRKEKNMFKENLQLQNRIEKKLNEKEIINFDNKQIYITKEL